MKKILACLLAASMLVMSFAACNKTTDDESKDSSTSSNSSESSEDKDADKEESEDDSEAPKKITTIKYVAPGAAPLDYETAIAAVNEKMGADIGVNIEIEYIAWDAWSQKTNLKLTTGEPFDLLQIMQTHSALISAEALTDITDIVKEVGTNYLASVPESVIEAAKVEGKLYIMPTYWYEPAHETNLLIRTDLRDKYGFENPSDPWEMLDQLEVIMNDWDGETYKPYLSTGAADISPTGAARTCTYHISYDRYPFTVKNEMVIIYEDDLSMASWVESEEFKEDCMINNSAYTRGLLYPDILTMSGSTKNDHTNSGEWYIGMGANVDISKNDVPEENFELFSYDVTGGQVMRPMSVKDTTGVPYTSENPAAAVAFVDWLYTSAENYNLFLYGIEGEHYTNIDDKHYELIINEETGTTDWAFADWMIGNVNYKKNDPAIILECVENSLYSVDETAIASTADSFSFNGSKVETELANVNTAIDTYVLPMYVGVVSYEENFEKAMDELYAAGYQAVMDEYQAQYADWKTANGIA